MPTHFQPLRPVLIAVGGLALLVGSVAGAVALVELSRDLSASQLEALAASSDPADRLRFLQVAKQDRHVALLPVAAALLDDADVKVATEACACVGRLAQLRWPSGMPVDDALAQRLLALAGQEGDVALAALSAYAQAISPDGLPSAQALAATHPRRQARWLVSRVLRESSLQAAQQLAALSVGEDPDSADARQELLWALQAPLRALGVPLPEGGRESPPVSWALAAHAALHDRVTPASFADLLAWPEEQREAWRAYKKQLGSRRHALRVLGLPEL